MFDPRSRYHALPVITCTDRRGRAVAVTPAAPDPHETLRGFHLRREGQRIDHLSFHYLSDAAGYWRICELAGVMLPEALTEAREIPIPPRAR
jgi:hypothetical protein